MRLDTVFIIALTFLGFSGILPQPSPCYSEETTSAIVNNQIQMIRSEVISQKEEAAKKIFSTHNYDKELFSAINEELLKGYQLNPSDGSYVNAMAWLCKALATSGDSEYRSTLEEISLNAENKKLRNYGKISSEILEKYIIRKAPHPDFPDDLSHETMEYINMINSGDDELIVKAASEIFKSNISDEYLYDNISEVLLKHYKSDKDDGDYIDGVAWLCKALASSGIMKYRATLEEIAANASEGKVRKFAKWSLEEVLLFEPAPTPKDNESIIVVCLWDIILSLQSQLMLQSFEIIVDGESAVELVNKSYSWFRVSPGRHVIDAKWPEDLNAKTVPTLLHVEPGKTYYMMLDPDVTVYMNGKKIDNAGELLKEATIHAIIGTANSYVPGVKTAIDATARDSAASYHAENPKSVEHQMTENLDTGQTTSFSKSFADAIIADPGAPAEMKGAVIGASVHIQRTFSSIFTDPTHKKPALIYRHEYIKSKFL